MPMITMVTTSATPERILESGKSYNVSRSAARELLDAKAAVLAAPNAVPTKIPAQPDPEDNAFGDDDDDEGAVSEDE